MREREREEDTCSPSLEMEGVKTKPVTVLHAVLENCCKLADKPAISWLNKHCEVVETYTYGELERRSGDIARGLLQLVQENNTQVEAKERIVLYYPPGLEFFIAFLACLRAGVIPGMLQGIDYLLCRDWKVDGVAIAL